MCIKYLLLLLITNFVNTIEFNCYPCRCLSRIDGRFAKCSKEATAISLIKIPNDLGVVQKIDLSNQNFTQLEKYEFQKANLLYLEVIMLENCNIRTVDKNTFKNLTRLRLLNLALNKIKELDISIFQDNLRLNYINLHYNKLRTIDFSVFKNLTFLRTIDLSNNLLTRIENNLSNSNYLEVVRLHQNDLETLNGQIFGSGRNLKTVTLYKNKWKCNCNMLPIFKLSEKLENFNGTMTICSSPRYLENRPWAALKSSDFDCNPSIYILPNKEIVTEYSGNNVTLSCKATAEYNVDVFWLRRHERIDQDNLYYLMNKKYESNEYWANLTIVNITTNDDGLYRCAVKHENGYQEQYIALSVVKNITNNVIEKTSFDETKNITQNKDEIPDNKTLDDFHQINNDTKNNDDGNTIGNHLKNMFIIIIIVGSTIILIAIIIIAVYFLYCRKKPKLSKQSSVYSSQFVNAVNPNLTNRNSMRYSVEFEETEDDDNFNDTSTPLKSFRYEDNMNFYPRSPIYAEPIDTLKRIRS